MRTIILASGSPRRSAILTELGFIFDTYLHDFDETSLDHLPPAERVVALARAKARNALPAAGTREALIIGADTLVCEPAPPSPEARAFADASGAITLSKPADKDAAELMLRILSSRTHQVHTGLVVLNSSNGREESALSTSFVRFAPLSDREIEAYLDSGEWEGVAGAYRVQGLAALFIEEIKGSWSGIVGLPIRELYAIFNRLSIETPALLPGKFPPFGAR